jgi:hypothetical protein
VGIVETVASFEAAFGVAFEEWVSAVEQVAAAYGKEKENTGAASPPGQYYTV